MYKLIQNCILHINNWKYFFSKTNYYYILLLYIFGIFTYVCAIYLYALHGIAEKIVINCVINC